MKRFSTKVCIFIFISTLPVLCLSSRKVGDDGVYRRQLQQTVSSIVDVYLDLGFPEKDCSSTEDFGINKFSDLWNDVMRCDRCSSPYGLTTCDPFPKLEFRIRNRDIDQQELQKLVNTLTFTPRCVLRAFGNEFGDVQLNVTSETSDDLKIPPSSNLADYDAELYPLLDQCPVPEKNSTDNNDTVTISNQEGENKIQIFSEFDVRVDLDGEKSSVGEEDVVFDVQKPLDTVGGISGPSLEPPSTEGAKDDVVEEVAVIQPGEGSFTNSTDVPESLNFSISNPDINCSAVQGTLNQSYIDEVEASLGCEGCISVGDCKDGEGVQGILAVNQTQPTQQVQKFINTFWVQLVCSSIADDPSAEVAFNELPNPLEQPRLTDSTCQGDGIAEQKIKVPEIGIISAGDSSSVTPDPDSNNGDTNDDGSDGDGNDDFPIWIIFLIVAVVIIAVVLLVIVFRYKKQSPKESGVVGYPIHPSPITTPVSSAGRQAALLARAEQFGYTPTFR
eukprot:TRINITY_DN11980_c0_g1_i1.p1 TRINITY_DN11980_c0_g1~~TRINITY_DN11980_c0_g1_i1.p1  ORF type:complete len:537 (-),score=72.60 TRINITY_DN11980_c0_g1_i1:132-1637(-)